MAVNQDHYVNGVFHEPGEHTLTVNEFDTPYLGLVARVLVDPADPDDVAAVNSLQDRFGIDAASARPFTPPEYDTEKASILRAHLKEGRRRPQRRPPCRQRPGASRLLTDSLGLCSSVVWLLPGEIRPGRRSDGRQRARRR